MEFAPEKTRIARSFADAAADYDRFAWFQRETGDFLLARLGTETPGRILDLGSGTGYCTDRLTTRYPDAEIVALDLAENMLRVARGGGMRGRHFLCADAESMPFRDARFDLVVSNLTLQWCGRPRLALRELHRVLKPGGRVIASTLAADTLRELKLAWGRVDGHVHVNQFQALPDIMRDVGEAGFAGIHHEAGRQQAFYPSFNRLAADLKGIGARNLNRGQAKGLTGKGTLARVRQTFDAGFIPGKGIPVTYEVVYLDLVR